MIAHLLIVAVLLFGAAPEDKGTRAAKARGLINPFFAMDTSTRDEKHQSVESQLQLVKETGFAGWACNVQDMREPLKIADQLGLKIFAIYAGIDIDAPEPGWDPKLPDAVRELKGRETA